jgi:hypothetical protein
MTRKNEDASHVLDAVDGTVGLAAEAAKAYEAGHHEARVQPRYQASDNATNKTYDYVFG